MRRLNAHAAVPQPAPLRSSRLGGRAAVGKITRAATAPMVPLMEAIMRSVMLLAVAALLAGCTQTAHIYPIQHVI
jgi:hypothetical protein